MIILLLLLILGSMLAAGMYLLTTRSKTTEHVFSEDAFFSPEPQKKMPTPSPSPSAGSLLSADDEGREQRLCIGGKFRSCVMRRSLGMDPQGTHSAAWGCLFPHGALAITSDVGEDKALAAFAQAQAALRLNDALASPEGLSESSMRAAFAQAHDAIKALRGNSEVGVTALALSMREDRIAVGQIGANRVLRLRGGELSSLCAEHSVLEDFLKQKGLDREKSAALIDEMPMRFKTPVTRMLGMKEGEPSVQEHSLLPSDWLIALEHGLILALGEVGLRQMILKGGQSPTDLADSLVAEGRTRLGRTLMVAVVGPEQG